MRTLVLSFAFGFGLLVACSSTTPTPTPDAGDDAAVDLDSGPLPAASIVVNDFSYKPSKVTVKVGDVVRWTFTKGRHSVTSGSSCTMDTNPLMDSGEQDSPFVYEFTFTEAGTFPFFCTYMKHCSDYNQFGTVTVVP
ncbi:hypothetical protein BH09MYX1_BH09MYX1_25380 [soil metagenome]